MKRILVIGFNDLRLFLKHRSSYVWLFVIPLGFVYVMGAANRGRGDPYNRRAPVLIENQDTNFLGKIFLDELGAQGMRLIDPTNRETAARSLRIPPDFTTRVLQQRQQVKVEFSERDNSAEADAALIEARLVRALIALNGHILEAATRPDATQPLTEEQLRAVMKAPDPVTLKAEFAGRQPVPSSYRLSVPGNLVMFLMMNLLIFGGTTLAAERANGVIKRLMVHPIRRGEIVMGKIFGLTLLGLVQIVFLLVAGRYLFKANLGAHLPEVLLTLLVFAWVAASLGVLAGSVMSAHDRVIGVCVLATLLMAAVGGCWWPMEVAPPGARMAALCVPAGWALKALHQLITFGNGIEAILVPLAVLLGFGVAANVLAMRFFRS